MGNNMVINICIIIITVCCLVSFTDRDKKEGKSKSPNWFSKFLQVSKFITAVLLLMEVITWLITLISVVKSEDVNNLPILIECTRGTVDAVRPYFSLTCVERVTNSDIISQVASMLKKGG